MAEGERALQALQATTTARKQALARELAVAESEGQSQLDILRSQLHAQKADLEDSITATHTASAPAVASDSSDTSEPWAVLAPSLLQLCDSVFSASSRPPLASALPTPPWFDSVLRSGTRELCAAAREAGLTQCSLDLEAALGALQSSLDAPLTEYASARSALEHGTGQSEQFHSVAGTVDSFSQSVRHVNAAVSGTLATVLASAEQCVRLQSAAVTAGKQELTARVSSLERERATAVAELHNLRDSSLPELQQALNDARQQLADATRAASTTTASSARELTDRAQQV